MSVLLTVLKWITICSVGLGVYAFIATLIQPVFEKMYKKLGEEISSDPVEAAFIASIFWLPMVALVIPLAVLTVVPCWLGINLVKNSKKKKEEKRNKDNEPEKVAEDPMHCITCTCHQLGPRFDPNLMSLRNALRLDS